MENFEGNLIYFLVGLVLLVASFYKNNAKKKKAREEFEARKAAQAKAPKASDDPVFDPIDDFMRNFKDNYPGSTPKYETLEDLTSLEDTNIKIPVSSKKQTTTGYQPIDFIEETNTTDNDTPAQEQIITTKDIPKAIIWSEIINRKY